MGWPIPFLSFQPGSLQATRIQVHHACDTLSGLLICGMVLFCPWAFGTTQPWSIWTMNLAGYSLGLLLMLKIWIRAGSDHLAARWEQPRKQQTMREAGLGRAVSKVEWVLGAACGLLLLYVLVSALNARATYIPNQLSFAYHQHVPWLPHSLDSARTWSTFWNYLALACAFWAIRDWLLGRSETEDQHTLGANAPAPSPVDTPPFPRRLRLLLWLLAINGGLLAMEGIIQRLEGSGKLLFLVRPRVNPGAVSQFGPWAYRANAAAWFNLVWPVCLGFWWTLHHHGGHNQRRHHWLLLCALLMAACPIISTSRGGALITLGLVTLAALYLLLTTLLFHDQRQGWRSIGACALVLLFSAGALGLGLTLGWKALAPRLAELSSSAELRAEMYEKARPMARDYPIYGTGPGSFATVFQLYRISTDTYWPAQLHNDWLETRITFGWVGSALIFLAFGCVLAQWFSPGLIHGGRRFVGLIWLAQAGCLVHARYDYPLQVYSVLFLFLTHCSVLAVLSRSRKTLRLKVLIPVPGTSNDLVLRSTHRTGNSSSSRHCGPGRH